jgi:thioredoxin 1
MTVSAPYLSALEAPSRSEVDALPGLTMLEFGTVWCGHCRAAQTAINQALQQHPQWQHLKVEDGPGRALGRSYRVKLWPTLILLREGQEVGRVVRPTAEPEVRSALTLALNSPNLLPPNAV